MSLAACISESTGNQGKQAATVQNAGAGAKPPTAKAMATNAPRGPRGLIVIDGLNLFFANNFHPRLEAVLTVFADIIASGYDATCVFDATTRYKIADRQGGEYVEAYIRLLDRYGDFFVETTGGVPANAIVLSLAEMHNARIVSNDQYRDWQEDFDFLAEKNRIIKVNAWRDVLFVGSQRLRIDSDLRTAMAKVEKLVTSHHLN